MNDQEMVPRKILHLDLDAFFCAVEEQHDSSLRRKPFAVGGHPSGRGVVASCSYAARKYGVRSAMPMARALQLCPELIVVSSRHGHYGEISRKVVSHLYDLTNLVEQISIDEAFLDVSDLRPSGEEIARRLQAIIWNEEGLPSSLGVATNKLVAKIANDVGKRSVQSDDPPMAIQVVPPGQEAAFLAPLPVEALWGIGPKTAARLKALAVETIGDVACLSEQELGYLFGKHGRSLAKRARGIDDRPIAASHQTKSISRETTFSENISEKARLCHRLRELSESVGRRTRRASIRGTTVKLKLRWADFSTLTRQTTLDEPTDQDAEIYRAALALFETTWKEGQPVRLIGVGISGLRDPVRQLSLWGTPSEEQDRLQKALDSVRERFGRGALRHASDLFWEGDEKSATRNES